MRYVWISVLVLTLACPSLASARPHSTSNQVFEAACSTQPISCGQTVTGSLTPACPINYFTFSGLNSQEVAGTLSSSAFPPTLQLIDPTSNVVDSASALNPGTVQFQIGLNASGNWSWAVTSNQSSPSGAYSFSFQCPTTSGPGCIGNDATLCLNSGRFKVTATFDAGGGNAGTAHLVALTGDTGYLWFFAPSNVEAVIKVLNGCGLGGHYWVFAGGLTDVKVIITVTDTQTGTRKIYRNPANTTFLPIQDTSAFATCP